MSPISRIGLLCLAFAVASCDAGPPSAPEASGDGAAETAAEAEPGPPLASNDARRSVPTIPVQFQMTHWTTEDGLPAHTVTGIAQTSDGFLWIATTGGLSRFDGARFEVETDEGPSGLPSPRLNGLAKGRSSTTLWVVTEAGQVARRDGQTFTTLGTIATYGPQPIGIDREGYFFARLQDQLLLPDGTTSPVFVAGDFATDRSGHLWIQCEGDRMCRLLNNEAEARGDGGIDRLIPGSRLAVTLRASGDRWSAASTDGEALGSFPARGVPRLLDRQGRLWTTDGAAVSIWAPEGEQPLATLALPSTFVSQVYEDREGVVWLATTDAGLISVREAPFAVISEAQGLPPGPVTTITEARGAHYVSANQTLYRIESDRATRAAVPPEAWFGVAEDANGTLWLAGNARVLGLPRQGAPISLGFGASQIVPSDAGLWLRGRNETLLAVERQRQLEVVRRIPTAGSHSLTVDPDGTVWVATDEGLVRIGAEGVRTLTPEDGLPAAIIRTVHSAQDGALWIGTYGGGLARLKDGEITVLDETRGLAEDIVSSLFEDETGMLWMGGNQSIHRVRRADAEAVLDGRADRATGVAYGRRDGLANPEGSGWPAFQADDGTIWFPTFEGVAVLDPLRAQALEAAIPLVHVEGVQTATRTLGTGQPARIDPNERRFTVSFTAASLRMPERVRYQYRLDGLDDEWIGPTPDREATFTNVPPGDYQFLVRAQTNDGAWSEPSALTVQVTPMWWETTGFRLFALLALVASGVVAVRRRDHHLRERTRQLDATVAARTAELEAEKETVAKQAEALRTLDEAKNRLFANVSHEFRTPLQLILGPLADLREGRHGDIPPEARDQVRLAMRNGERLLALVEQLLALARSDAGQLEVHPTRLDAAAFARGVAGAFRPLAEREDIAFVVDVPAAEGVFDPSLVETALANLLANAFSFTPAGGTVTLTLVPGAEGAPLLFRVSDTGPGVDPSHAERIFDRFYQAEATRRGSGTGIGLSLVREIADLHGGTACVESEVGRGSTFTLAFPFTQEGGTPSDINPGMAALLAASGASGDGQGRTSPAPPEAPRDTPRVLVVDDNADLRDLVRRHLDDRYIVTEAASGDAALALAREHLPDAIVSDVTMPGLDGLSLVRALRGDPETDFVPILLLTARAAVSDTVDGLQAGADDYLAKPFAPAELRARVDALISGRQRLRERWQGEWQADLPLPAWGAIAPEATHEQRGLVERFVAVIDARLDDDSLSVEALAEALGMSRATLYRRLDGATEGTPADLLREVRLVRAAGLLARGAGSVGEVAYGVGFKSVSHFSARFRERYGATPSAYARAPEAHGPARQGGMRR